MPNFKVYATSYEFYEVVIKAKDAEEAYAKARELDGGQWVHCDHIGDWSVDWEAQETEEEPTYEDDD